MIPPSQQPADEDDVRSNNPVVASDHRPMVVVDKFDVAISEMIDYLTSDKCAKTQFEGSLALRKILEKYFPNANV